MIDASNAPSWLRQIPDVDRLGPWLPPPLAAARRSVPIVPDRRLSRFPDSWRVRGRVALERVDGLAVASVDRFAGDLLALALVSDRRILWICGMAREHLGHTYLRPVPGAWGLTLREALSHCEAGR